MNSKVVSAYSEYNVALLHNIVNNSVEVSILIFFDLYFIILLNEKRETFLSKVSQQIKTFKKLVSLWCFATKSQAFHSLGLIILYA